RSRGNLMALPATAEAVERSGRDRYSHSSVAAAEGVRKLQNGQWKSPAGSLIIVDDADHLTRAQITWLMTNAGATNTKLVLAISNDGVAGPSRHLAEALVENLPWSADRNQAAEKRSTAISRISAHLNRIEHPATTSQEVAGELLAQLRVSLSRYRELAAPLRWRTQGFSEKGRDAGLSR
ncbi:hypothetical protein, partial [Mycolicibacterium sp.]|uniref:hypothetical protein n=1 Tax=Mycolicibacterium sp. TaxID=2320850 RepID=UPI0025EF7ECB